MNLFPMLVHLLCERVTDKSIVSHVKSSDSMGCRWWAMPPFSLKKRRTMTVDNEHQWKSVLAWNPILQSGRKSVLSSVDRAEGRRFSCTSCSSTSGGI